MMNTRVVATVVVGAMVAAVVAAAALSATGGAEGAPPPKPAPAPATTPPVFEGGAGGLTVVGNPEDFEDAQITDEEEANGGPYGPTEPPL